MANLTYRQIKKMVDGMTEEQLDMTATVYDVEEDEYHPINDLDVTKETDVLDEYHPFFEIKKDLF